MSKGIEFANTLRTLADFYEAHPEVPEPYAFKYGSLCVFLPEGDGKAVLRSLGSFEKSYRDDDLVASKQVGDLKLKFFAKRDDVCVRKVVGVKQVAEQLVPEQYTPSHIIPAHDEEIVEWECEPVMADGKDSPHCWRRKQAHVESENLL